MSAVIVSLLAVLAVSGGIIFAVTEWIEDRRRRRGFEAWTEFCRINNQRASRGLAPVIHLGEFRA